MSSVLYAGVVTHARLKPRPHRLRYRLLQGLFDLDELPALGQLLSLFSHNRPNLFSFHDRDHGDGSGDLRGWVERQLAEAGIGRDGGRISLLCMPRILGFAFNPLSVFFCWNLDGRLIALLYQVNNTFGQRHSYLIPVTGEARPIRQACDKRFHVSPFMEMALRYEFTVSPPEDQLAVKIAVSDQEGPLLDAVFAGQRRPLNDRLLLWSLAAYPLMTLKVVAGIHWEALRLWLKGVGLNPEPPPPSGPVTVVRLA
jgi:DUF1365 family protein